MNRILLLLSFVLITGTSFAQLDLKDTVIKKAAATENPDTVAWIYGASFNLGANQGFIHNWAAGGELASVAVNGLGSLYVTRLYHRHMWNNNLYMSHGLLYAYSSKFIPRKTDDRIDFISKYGVRLDSSSNFYITGLLNFITQFTKGYNYDLPEWDTFSTSNFLSPGYLTLAPGIEYRRGSNFTLFLSPAAARFTFADKYYTSRHPEGAFGIEYGETSRFELGAYFVGNYQADISKDIFYRARVTLYSNYLAKSDLDTLGNVIRTNHPGNIDVFLDNVFSLKIAKYLNLLLNFTFIYDNDIPYETMYVDENGVKKEKDDPGRELGWWQVKQTMTIGLHYEF